MKAEGLWPGNKAKGIANHQSTIVLFDPGSGSPHALVRGTYLTALRTAAASALSIRHLARKDSQTLGILGAGGQAVYQLKAALPERSFSKLLIHDASEEAAGELKSQFENDLSPVWASRILPPRALLSRRPLTPNRLSVLIGKR
ncbi:MAG: hypothetical protein AAF950_03135 [Pseudomonadota bacterium]